VGVIPKEFFKEVQGAAILKHGILRNYLTVFTSKLGFRSAENKVAYFDAYAGAGEYEGGKEGSPALAKQTAELLAQHRNLIGIYVESDPDNLAKLEACFEGVEAGTHKILPGTIEEKFDEALGLIGDLPLLAFFDPFGLTVPMDRLVSLFRRPKPQGSLYPPPTELIINVSYPGIARQCGGVRSTKGVENPTYAKIRETIIKKCDTQLGGDWWQPISIKRDDNWVVAIAHGYALALAKAIGAAWYRVFVRDRPDGPIAYELLFITTHPREGLWHVAEAVSSATEKYQAFVAEQAGQQLLPFPTSQWVQTIKTGIVKRLQKGEFVLGDAVDDVYGETLGLARGKHVRAAIKELFAEGISGHNGVGKEINKFRITRGPNFKPGT
jgi:three-Cys-motif partner protein